MASRGPDDAPVTIFEFSDFQCPYCARGFDTVEELLQRYPEEIRFVYLHYPLSNHNWAKPAAIASICAANQDDEAFWPLHDSYFRNQGDITPETVIEDSRRHLEGTGIDLDLWQTCALDMESADYLYAEAKVEASMEAAERDFGVTGTPAFFINGQRLSGAHPIETFEEIVQELLAQ